MRQIEFQSLAEFLASELSVELHRLAQQTRIQEDLGCTGDDALELMDAFAKRFDVDMTRFWFSDHFGNEAGNPGFSFAFWFWLWSAFDPLLPMRLEKSGRLRVPITAGHLAKCANLGAFVHPGAAAKTTTQKPLQSITALMASGAYVVALSACLAVAIVFFSIGFEATLHTGEPISSIFVLATCVVALWNLIYRGIASSRDFVTDRLARLAELRRAGQRPALAIEA